MTSASPLLKPLHRSFRLQFVLLLALTLLGFAAMPGHARADGDPGSDVLIEQNLFYGPQDGVTLKQELQLGKLLNATASVGQPVRVAIIGQQTDLGTVTTLWGEPQTYAEYLGSELAGSYSGRLLVVMPSRFGVYWKNNVPQEDAILRALSRVQVAGGSGTDLVTATTSAVYTVEKAAGISQAQLDKAMAASSGINGTATVPTGGGAVSVGTGSAVTSTKATTAKRGHPDAIVIVIAVLLLIAYVAWRRGARLPRLKVGSLKGTRIKPIALLPTLLLVIVVVALVLNHTGSPKLAQTGDTLATNPNLDPGTALPARMAPNFKLIDETGQTISLKQYRGKVVILSFIDDECETICPLTSQAMLDAKRSLGAAGKDVQLLAVNANWRSTQVDDVLNYTQAHGMTGQWHFLTSASLTQLNRVWTEYGVDEFKKAEKKQESDSNLIDHVASTYVIAPDGRFAKVYTTQSNYGAIPQLGQLLAKEASSLLPGHPKVQTHYSYAEVRGTPPTSITMLPTVGGGNVTLGPGHEHMYVFFDTWDQVPPVATELEDLNAYARQAKKEGLPSLVAVDEAPVEPSSTALTSLLKHLPRKLDYPVAVDKTGAVADGYTVEGEPWFVATETNGTEAWYREVYTSTWPKLSTLLAEAHAALHPGSATKLTASETQKDLAGSPPVLAQLHAQSSKELPGGITAMGARIKALRGYPIVLNVWSTYCPACVKEFGLFAKASAQFGKKVAFLGADVDEHSNTIGQLFLDQNHVSYPNYQMSETALDQILPGGLPGTPTTIFIAPDGKFQYDNPGNYASLAALEADIDEYSLGDK